MHDIYEQYTEERDKVARLSLKLSSLDRENKALEVKFVGETEDKVRQIHDEHEHEQRKLTHKVRELEKRLEVMKVNSDERLNLALDNKDKEFSKLKDKIQTIQFEHQHAL